VIVTAVVVVVVVTDETTAAGIPAPLADVTLDPQSAAVIPAHPAVAAPALKESVLKRLFLFFFNF
jgi:hypothetical protein